MFKSRRCPLPVMSRKEIQWKSAKTGEWDFYFSEIRFPSFEVSRSRIYCKTLYPYKQFCRDEAGAVVLRGHTDVVHDMRFIPQLDVLASVSSDKTMRVWRLNDYSCAAVYK